MSMSGTSKTLLLIAGFVAIMVASFVWFIATWDREAEEPVVRLSNEEIYT